MSVRETALSALFAALTAVPGARVERETVTPEVVPQGGLIIQRDGAPGEPEVFMSPLTYSFEHAVTVEVMAQNAPNGARAIALDGLLVALGQVLAEDRTLAGTVDWLEWAAPHTDDLAVPAGAAIKGATVTVTLFYSTDNPLL